MLRISKPLIHRCILFLSNRTYASLRTLARLKREKQERAAATAIQKVYRGQKQRKAFFKLRSVVILTQSWARRVASIKEKKQRIKSLLIVQKYARGFLARLHYRRTRIAIKVQALWRCFVAHRAYIRYVCATQIQAVVRGSKQRKAWHREKAAWRIQRTFRGMEGRRRVKKIRCAITIQCAFRSCKARSELRKLRSVVQIQKTWRGYACYVKYQRMRCVTKIQALVRGFLTRRKTAKLKASVAIIIKKIRVWVGKRIFERKVERLHKAAKAGTVHVVGMMVAGEPWLRAVRQIDTGFENIFASLLLSF